MDKETQIPTLSKTAVSGSVLIAKFMNEYKEPSLRDIMTDNRPFSAYDTWHSLMPVVEKICKEKYDDGDTAYLRNYGMINDEFQFMVRFNRQQLFSSNSLLKASYLAVVDFLRNRL